MHDGGAPTLSLDKAIKISRTYELSKAQLKSMESGSGVVHGIIKGQQYQRNSSSTPSRERTQSCGKWDNIHTKDSCLSMGGTCLKCGEANHFARMCRTSNKQVHEVTEAGY